MSKKKPKHRTLTKLVDAYDRDREISSIYVGNLRNTCRRFENFLGREGSTDDFKPKIVNAWLKHERDAAAIGDRSRMNHRINVLTLWKFSGVRLDSEKIRGVKVTPKNPEAWHYDELVKVTDAARQLRGKLANGVPRSLYMSAVLWFAYETGLRRRDIWEFDVRSFSGLLANVTQHKTRKVHIVQVTERTLSDLMRIQSLLIEADVPDPHIVFRWPQSERQFYYWMKSIREACGIDPGVSNRALQHMRRTGATEVDRNGGDAWKFLGHTKGGLDRKSYIDGVKNATPTSPGRIRHDEETIARAPTVPPDHRSRDGGQSVAGEADPDTDCEQNQ